MTQTTKILGQFIYQADILPRGARNWRRGLLAATTEYEIPEAHGDEIDTDAVVFVPAGSKTPIHLAALRSGGGLLRPAPFHPGVPDIATYRTLMTEWVATAPRADPLFPGIERIPLKQDPIAASHGPDDDHHWPNLMGMETHTEEGFIGRGGKIGLNDKAASHARHQASTRHVAILDGIVHYTTLEPAWLAETTPNGTPVVRLVDRVNDSNRFNGHRIRSGNRTLGDVCIGMFPMHRLDDAIEWSKSRNTTPPVIEGRVVGARQSFADSSPLTAVLHGALENLLGPIEACKEHLSAAGYAAWGRLHASSRTVKAYDFGDLADPDGLLIDLCTIRDNLTGRMLPWMLQPQASMLIEHIEALETRAAFEMRLKPALTEEDDFALSTAGSDRRP